MNQREAVYSVVSQVVEFNPGEKVQPTKDQLKLIHQVLVDMFISGEIEIRGDRDEEYFRKYVPGLTNNWLRKDTRLNGGVKYESKNPGSRSHSGDEKLRALRTLRTQVTDPEHIAAVDQAIEERLEELKPKINPEHLPEHLRHLVG